jgi:hypothetical protein
MDVTQELIVRCSWRGMTASKASCACHRVAFTVV